MLCIVPMVTLSKEAFGALTEDEFSAPDISIPLSVIIEDLAELK